MKPYEKRDLCD